MNPDLLKRLAMNPDLLKRVATELQAAVDSLTERLIDEILERELDPFHYKRRVSADQIRPLFTIAVSVSVPGTKPLDLEVDFTEGTSSICDR